jgi:hypothetical protein
MRSLQNDHRLWPHGQTSIEKLFADENAALKATLTRSRKAGLPPISMSPAGGSTPRTVVPYCAALGMLWKVWIECCYV